MTVHEMKKDFVENELTSLLKKVDDIEKAEYFTTEYDEEFVRVFYSAPSFATIIVNVTADSLSALTKDVLQAVE